MEALKEPEDDELNFLRTLLGQGRFEDLAESCTLMLKKFPNSSKTFNECLSLPLYPNITRIQQDYVIDNLLKLQK